MTANYTASGIDCNHTGYAPRHTIRGVADDKTINKVLWANLRALMVNRYGEENLNRLAREAKLGPGTPSRIKAVGTAVRISTLEKIARTFRIEPWQLLAPGMNDDKFLDVLKAWQDTDGRGRRMILNAASGATADESTEQERSAGRARRP